MLAHAGGGPVLVLSLDRVEDGAVGGQAPRRAAGAGERGAPRLVDRLRQVRPEPLEQRVAAPRARSRCGTRRPRRPGRRLTRWRPPSARARRAWLGGPRPRGAGRRASRSASRSPRAPRSRRAAPRSGRAARFASEGSTSSGDAGEEHPAAVADADQSRHLERRQRLAHRRAAHAEPLGELALRHEPVARLEALNVDQLAQPLDDLLVEPAAPNRAKRALDPLGTPRPRQFEFGIEDDWICV